MTTSISYSLIIGLPAVGLGEAVTTAVAPAIGNAIFVASGARLRHLPIRPEAVREGSGIQTDHQPLSPR